MELRPRRVKLFLLSLLVTFSVIRMLLFLSPNADFNIGAYNIHHLFTGLILIALGGIPLVICSGNTVTLDIATLAFGAGLSLALDEWIFLIATDGNNISYFLPVSFWGGVLMVGIASAYVVMLCACARQRLF